jgi:hypothetical protein
MKIFDVSVELTIEEIYQRQKFEAENSFRCITMIREFRFIFSNSFTFLILYFINFFNIFNQEMIFNF